MEIYTDLRCFQDPHYAYRGVGYHAGSLLTAGRPYFPRSQTEWIGLVDPSLPSLPPEFAALVDDISLDYRPRRTSRSKLFIQTSPMTHDAGRYAHFLADESIVCAALVYDFIPLDLAERYLNHYQDCRAYLQRLAQLARYDLHFPISACVATRLSELVRVPPASVHVTGVGVRPAFEQSATAAALDSTGMPPYFLFVGGADGRKNVEVVLKAHAGICSPDKPQLRIVGNYTQRSLAKLRSLYRACGGQARDLLAASDVDDVELAQLYRNCICLVCSSEMEGFSLPPVEASSCGSPLLLSNNAAHRELSDLPEAMFEPADATRLSRLMRRAWHDRDWRDQVAKIQSNVADNFRMDRVAYRFWGPLSRKDFSINRPLVERESQHIRSEPKHSRLAILTPFPPDRTGVADYTRRTIQQLGQFVDVDVFCDTPDPQPTSGVRKFFPLSEAPFQSPHYDQVLTVLGNSHFHAKIFDLQLKYGGPCLVHDNRLLDYYKSRFGVEKLRNMAAHSLKRRISVAEVQQWVEQPGRLPSMFFDELVAGANPLIVHSRAMQAQVQQQYAICADYLPFSPYRHFDDALLTEESVQQKRQALGIPKDAVAMITLGLVSPVKAPDACIAATALLRQRDVNAHLYFVGSCRGQEKRLRAWASRHGVLEAVHFCGSWLDEDRYRDFLIAADLAIQLRTHFWGGLSGALADCISAGVVSVANRDLADAVEAPDYVLRVEDRPQPDPSELADALLRAVAMLKSHDRLSAMRRRYLDERSFTAYCRQLIKILGLESIEPANLSVAAA